MREFSLREWVPGQERFTDAEIEAIETGLLQTYYSIDLMMALCGDRKYKRVYGPVRHTITDMERRLKGLPKRIVDGTKIGTKIDDAELILADMKTLVAAADTLLKNGDQEILDELDGVLDTDCCGCGEKAEEIELWMFFVKQFKNPDGTWMRHMGAIAEKWVELLALAPNYLCLPWAEIQKDDQEPTVDPLDMCDHMDEIGEFSMYDFYAEPKSNRTLVRAIRNGRKKNIFTRSDKSIRNLQPPDDGLRIKPNDPPPNNGKVCVNNTCVNGTGFCTTDEAGNCSAVGG